MIQHQGTMKWGPHMDPTPLCLGVVSLLCSVSVRITPHKSLSACNVYFIYLLVAWTMAPASSPSRPLHRRSNCLSLCSLAPLLPPFCSLSSTSPVHHFRLSIAWQCLPFQSYFARKMGWQLLSCCLKT
jgi:hypothetical protein